MRGAADEINEVIAVFSGNLVVGNHDSITLFGIHAQNELKATARKVSSILLKDSEDIDRAIGAILAEAERAEGQARSGPFSFLRKNTNEETLDEAVLRIEEAALCLKLQQAQLVKEAKLLEGLERSLASCVDELERYIQEGEAVLRGRSSVKAEGGSLVSLEAGCEDGTWYARLERRIGDLCVSRTVAQQSRAQIKLLLDSNLVAFDRIAGAVTNLPAICQTQVVVGLGADLQKNRLYLQSVVRGVAGGLSPAGS